MDNIQPPSGRVGATAAFALVLAVAAALTACASTSPLGTQTIPPPLPPASSPVVVESPRGVDVAAICGLRPSSDRAPVTAGRIEACSTLVPRLNNALVVALRGQLPPVAVLTSSLNNTSGEPLGGRTPTFFPKPGGAGTLTYAAPVQIRNGDFTAHLELTVGTFDSAPTLAPCPSRAQADDMRAKGIVTNRCGRMVDLAGNILVINDVSSPFGTGEWADVLLRTYSVTAYRPDGIVVAVTVSPVLENATDPTRFQPGDQPTMFTSDQVVALATDRSLTLIGP
ncbi:hypothetical protein F4553_001421 [Allocatelliglobosispora scoriae]|uniref:Uncharacterized protein n=1 Tax=Allocatelliglobosispora scoriae TaxID=643052 RepID=A0A841BMR0_9ACTN|nr:hypothetical protein [Allocatelliglobosispora scoriae]MBB5868042.1 hypothetical protein [Allocatelliglobosispora scoriae]